MAIVHNDTAKADRVSGMATPGKYLRENSSILTTGANNAIASVNQPFAGLAGRKYAAVKSSNEIGRSAKKVTEA
jgi:hypothetical protein